MHYSPVATQKYRRAYRLWQIKQAVRIAAVLLAVGAGVTVCLLVLGSKEERQRRDTFGVPIQQTTATIVVARTVQEKTTPVFDEVTFSKIEGRTFTWRFLDTNKVFTPGKRAIVHYRVGHSGDIYVKDAEPLP